MQRVEGCMMLVEGSVVSWRFCGGSVLLRNENFNSKKVARRLVHQIFPLHSGAIAGNGVEGGGAPAVFQVRRAPYTVVALGNSWHGENQLAA